MAQPTGSDNGSPPADPESQIKDDQEANPEEYQEDPSTAPAETDSAPSNWNKPLSFYLAFLSLVIMVLLVSLDATALAVAIPVGSPPMQMYCLWSNMLLIGNN